MFKTLTTVKIICVCDFINLAYMCAPRMCYWDFAIYLYQFVCMADSFKL